MRTILLCIPMLNNAGAQRFVADLAANLDKNKNRVIVVTTRKTLPDAIFHKQLVEFGIDVRDVSGKNYIKEFFNIRKLIKTENPSIVHTNLGSSLHVLLPVWLRGKKIVHLFTVHSMGYRIFRGLKMKLMKIAFKTRKVIPVAICDTVKRSVCETYDLNEDMVPCIYNGVNTSAFPAKTTYCENGVVHFVSVGTLYEIKNHKMLVNAFAELKKKHCNVKLTIVGGGKLYDDLNDQIMSLNIEKDVTMAGDCSNISEILSSADVYCCPSKVEGLPISVLEAMSSGLPIITTPAGGVVDIVKENVNGFIVPHDDFIAMSEKMAFMVENQDVLRSMGELSRKEALQYDVKICATGYEQLYDTVSK